MLFIHKQDSTIIQKDLTDSTRHQILESVTMLKQMIVQSFIEAVEIIDTPIPTPEDKDVVIKVIVSG